MVSILYPLTLTFYFILYDISNSTSPRLAYKNLEEHIRLDTRQKKKKILKAKKKKKKQKDTG